MDLFDISFKMSDEFYDCLRGQWHQQLLRADKCSERGILFHSLVTDNIGSSGVNIEINININTNIRVNRVGGRSGHSDENPRTFNFDMH